MASIVEETTAAQRAHDKRWWVLAVLAIAQLMVVLDATVVNIALPDAQKDLGFSDSSRQWVITGYTLAFGSLLLLGGRLSDLVGRRLMFITGLIGFAVASAVGGAATNFHMLVGARVAQGVFGAMLAPAALALLTVTFTEPKEKAKAFGIFSAVAGAGAAIGLLLGGALTEWASWRWALFVNLAFAGVALVGALLLLARHVAHGKASLDLPGTITATAGLFAIVYGFSHAADHGWSSATTVWCLIIGLILLVLFVIIETRVAQPLLPMRIVLDRHRGGAYLSVFVAGIGMFAVFLFLTYYMQLILEYTPIVTGVAYMPMVVGMILSSTTGPTLLLPRFGPKVVSVAGFLVGALAMVMLTGIDLHSNYASHVLPGLLLMGLGLGASMSAAFACATSNVHHTDAGVASAMVNTSQQVGGSIGTALLSTFAATAATNYIAGKNPGPLTFAEAQVHSYIVSFWWAAGFLLAGAILMAIIMPNSVPVPAEGEPVLAG
ncbi:MFS transporter [Nocardia sp. XZ_19_385]|uniref:MFS transporter n=1 Tax=Nocardia sp. XZ_19_385 TaxID=2769488 RepID=UPI00188EE6C8|nr:MFS transporter [Nocardia sp. XZ_19_385]